jgi:hypothetical protein
MNFSSRDWLVAVDGGGGSTTTVETRNQQQFQGIIILLQVLINRGIPATCTLLVLSFVVVFQRGASVDHEDLDVDFRNSKKNRIFWYVGLKFVVDGT